MNQARQSVWAQLVRKIPIRLYFLCMLWAALVIFAVSLDFGPLIRQELSLVDLRFKLRGQQDPTPDIIILGIDQESCSLSDRFDPLPPELYTLKNFPYPRSVYADAINWLNESGAEAVGLDLLFFSPTDQDNDLREMVERYQDRVVLGSNISDDGIQLLEPAVVVPGAVPLKKVAGFVNYWPDTDGVIRKARSPNITALDRFGNQRPAVSFDELVVEKARASMRWGTPTFFNNQYINYSGPPGNYRTIPFYQLFYTNTWENLLQRGEVFRNKIVLIGPTGNFQHDQHPTPFGQMDGVEIHASAIATLLFGYGPRDVAPWTGYLTIIALGLTTGLILTRSFHSLIKVFLLVVVCVGYFGVGLLAFIQWRSVLLIAGPIWAVAGSGILGIATQLVAEQLEKLRLRKVLELRVSKPVADEILRHSEDYASSLGGERKAVTILFADIRGFTTLAERMSPHDLVTQLNEYFTEMVDIVMRYNGTLDKFIGDALMAVYGAPMSTSTSEDAWNAIQSAYAMRIQLEKLTQTWTGQGRPLLKFGIGISHGDVIVGNIGSPQRMEYTVVGDAVNVASRVEALNKTYGTDILLTETVYELVKDRIETDKIKDTSIRGKEQKILVYTLKNIK